MCKSRGRIFIAVHLLVLAWACSGPHFYDLRIDVPEKTGGFKLDKVLFVENVEVNATYRDYRIVQRKSPYQVKYYHSASWSKSPGELIEDAAILFLKKRGIFKKVNTYGAGDNPDWTVRIYLDAIEKAQVQKKWFARLALEIEVTENENNEVLLIHSFDRRSPLRENRAGLIAQKVSALLQEELLVFEAKLAQWSFAAGKGERP